MKILRFKEIKNFQFPSDAELIHFGNFKVGDLVKFLNLETFLNPDKFSGVYEVELLRYEINGNTKTQYLYLVNRNNKKDIIDWVVYNKVYKVTEYEADAEKYNL